MRSNKPVAGSVQRSSRGLRVVLPDALGVATRLAARCVREAGIVLEPILKKAGLTSDLIDIKDTRIPVVNQIRFLELAAKALYDPLLGFKLACGCDLREMGLLHYAAGAAATLGEAIHRFERYSSIVNEGVVVKCPHAGNLTIELSYEGVSRHSDQQQMEFLVTTIVRSCRALTGCDLKPASIELVHQPSQRRPDLERYFGCRVAFGAEIDKISFDQKARQLSLVGADPYLNEILLDYCEQA